MTDSAQNTFETHLTLEASQKECVESARNWAIESGYKWTEIELSQGDFPLQPMITFWGSDSLQTQQVTAKEIETALSPLGIRVVRVKTETESSVSQVARSDQYFECHFKLHLNSNDDRHKLQRVAQSNSAHISRNARRVRDDGSEERFLTLRCYECDGVEAHAKEARLLESVRANGLEVMEVESEFVVFDSNLSLDAGWDRAHV